MGDSVLALTALRSDVLQQLARRGFASVELVSHQNVSVAMKVRPGDRVFVTDELADELSKGTVGAVCVVERVSVEWVRIRGAPEYDEREILRARLRLRYDGPAKVEKVEGADVDVSIPSQFVII